MTPARTALAGALAATALAACGTSPAPTTEPAPTDRTPTMPSTQGPAPGTAGPGTAIVLTIGDTTVDGQLWDNPAARDLAARLPLSLTVGDYGAVEKTAPLEPPLTMDGMPAGDDPRPGEIGWYAPGSVLVLYYGDVGYWNGIARLGTFDDAGVDLLRSGPSDMTVSLATATG